MEVTVWLVVCAVVAVLMAIRSRRRSKWAFHRTGIHSVKGTSLPLLGQLMALDPADPQKSLFELGKKHGGIFFMDFGPRKTVIVTDNKLIHQVSRVDALLGRCQRDQAAHVLIRGGQLPQGGLPGLVFSDGDNWSEIRKFTVQEIAKYGFAKIASIDDLVHSECVNLVKNYHELCASSKDGSHRLTVDGKTFLSAEFHVIWRMIVGESRVDQDMLENVKDFMASGAGTPLNIAQTYSATLTKLVAACGVKNILTAKRNIDSIISREIAEHTRSLDPLSPRDLLDVFLVRQAETTDPKSAFFGTTGTDNIREALFDLFFTGLDTTATSLSWNAVLMMRYPEVQRKVQEEIDRVIGTDPDVFPSINHRSEMPYTCAFISELLRTCCIVPIGPRMAMADAKIDGDRLIPEGTHIFLLEYGINYDPSIFENPEEFRPERFLPVDGQVPKCAEMVYDFGWGKRKCVGAAMSHLTLFLFICTQLKFFWFECDGDPANIDTVPVLGFSNQPKPVKAIVKRRI